MPERAPDFGYDGNLSPIAAYPADAGDGLVLHTTGHSSLGQRDGRAGRLRPDLAINARSVSAAEERGCALEQ